MSDAPALRHTGSADPMRSAREFTNQQYTATGVTRHCHTGNHWHSIGGGWKKTGPLKLWTCPSCQKEKANATR